MGEKNGKIANTSRRRILAVCLAVTLLPVITLALRPFSGLDSIGLARAQDDSAPALAAGSDTLAEWHVFLVATNNYYDPDDPNLPALRYAEADADSLEKIFKALGVKDENITVLKSSNQSYFTRSNKESIKEGYQRFLDGLTEKSIAFVFLCGHGFGEKTRSYYLPEDCTIKNRNEKKISIDDMMAELAASKARFKWMCVDACRNEIGKRGVGERSLSINDAPKGILLTQSCSEGQFSYEVGKSEGAPSDNGVFTRVFVNAISGRDPSADADQDGRVTLLELRNYVCRQAPLDARKYFRGATQNPVFTSLDGPSFEEFAKYPLFEDRDWREALRLREDAEKLVQQENYAEALKKIQKASQLRPKDTGIVSLKDEIEKLFNERDVNQKAEAAYKSAQEALNAKKYNEARSLIGEALRLKPGDSTYDLFRNFIDAQEKLDTKDPEKTEKPEVVITVDPVPTNPKPGESRKITINDVEVVFHWCPPGEFMMGSPSDEEDRRDDETPHPVLITKGFWFAETETTQAFWKAVMGKDNNPSRWKGDDLPMESVSWNDCQDFIKKLNEKTKDKGLQFRLPSEAHWEYACRAGSSTAYWWGNNPEDAKGKANVLDLTAEKEFFDLGWRSSFEDGFVYTSPVGSFTANDWNLKDMTGNVGEWCSNWNDEYPAGMATDPEGPENGLYRMCRGGSWYDDVEFCRSATRDGRLPKRQFNHLGFRLELSDVSDEEDSVYVDPVPTNPKPGESRKITINGVEVVFQWCPPGEFMMGMSTSEIHRIDGETRHKVVITKGFWLAETETSQALWKAVMGKDNNPSANEGDDLPVESVSWNDCQDFIKKLNKKTKDKGLLFRLPSEAHWEYACRAGSTTAYWWGNNPEDGKGKENVADASAKKKFPDWPLDFSFDDGFAYSSPVGSFMANDWSLKDMSGNVEEWCSDWYEDYPAGTAIDPEGPEDGSVRVLRGGSWKTGPLSCRSAGRGTGSSDVWNETLGFRLELSDVSGEQNPSSPIKSEDSELRSAPLTSFSITVDSVPTNPKPGESRKITINGVEVAFHWCPPGEFMMGSPSDEEDRGDDETPHPVLITKGFWLAETETTQAFWKAIMGKDNNPSKDKGDNLPVETVSWYDCQDFIKKLNKKTKDKGLQFRLPSEAHWEYACRAGSTTAYWWGNNPEDGEGKENVADASAKKEFPDWPLCFSFDDGFVSSSPVGSFMANDWNLKDMTGNVWEWCSDWYGDYPAAGTAIDPEGPQSGSRRVRRGGGWCSDPGLCRSADRDGDTPDYPDGRLGFRLELSDVK